MNWEQILAMNAPVITVMIGLFVWLRTDIKHLRDEVKSDMKRLEDRLEAKLESDIGRLEDRVSSDMKRLEDRLEAKLESDIGRLEAKLESDIKHLEDKVSSDMRRFEDAFKSDIERLEDKMDAGFLTVDDRLRQVEHEQARMAGLLEGLALTGRLPSGESQSA